MSSFAGGRWPDFGGRSSPLRTVARQGRCPHETDAEALVAYREALLVDPTNVFAQRNYAALTRLVGAPSTQTTANRRIPYRSLAIIGISPAAAIYDALFPDSVPVSPAVLLAFGILAVAWWSKNVRGVERDATTRLGP